MLEKQRNLIVCDLDMVSTLVLNLGKLFPGKDVVFREDVGNIFHFILKGSKAAVL